MSSHGNGQPKRYNVLASEQIKLNLEQLISNNSMNNLWKPEQVRPLLPLYGKSVSACRMTPALSVSHFIDFRL
jgi:hypothetical protein